MSYHRFKIKEEIDFYRAMAELEQQGIPYSKHMLRDSSIPALGFNEYYGELTVPESMKNKAWRCLIIQNIDFLEVARRRKTASWINITFFLLGTYSIAVSLLLLKYWLLHFKMSTDKNYSYQWNLIQTKEMVKERSTGQVVLIKMDVNWDNNFEYIQEFSSKGWMVAEYFDTNEDGIFERVLYYDSASRLSGVLLDANGDGLPDGQTIYLEDGDTLELSDTSGNGLFTVD
jgi:hypothetical protein